MKNLIIAFASILALTFSTQTFAQPANDDTVASIDKVTPSDSEVAILQDFKANKVQKKVIKKVRKYVTPRVLGGRKGNALEGKTVKVQLSFNQNGDISNMQIVNGFEESIDARVLNFIKEYDAKKPFSETDIQFPSVIQMEIPLVGKKRYMN